LIHKQKSRFRLSPDGRLSYAPKNQDWAALLDEVAELLHTVGETRATQSLSPEAAAAPI